MDIDEAKQLLLLHSVGHPTLGLEDPKVQSGFLGSLRPFTGRLLPKNFHQVMACIEALAPVLRRETVDRDVMSALWSIVHLGDSWGVRPDGMLRRNRLISDSDVDTLDAWIRMISYATMILLDGGPSEEAFHQYREYASK